MKKLYLFGMVFAALFLIGCNGNYEDIDPDFEIVNANLEQIKLVRESGFTLPEDSFHEQIIFTFGAGSYYSRTLQTGGPEGNITDYSSNIPNAQELANQIEGLILENNLLAYEQNPECFVADAGRRDLSFVYNGENYEFDLVTLDLCDDNLDDSEKTLLDIENIIKEQQSKIESTTK